MKVTESGFNGLHILEPVIIKDPRGLFIKQFNKSLFTSHNLESGFVESYYSSSQKGVIRGMHFQRQPKDHAKLIYVSHGSIIDVVLDLREQSQTYNQYYYIKLDAIDSKCIYIPRGFAHGFLSLENDTKVHYMQTSEYDAEHDCGILYSSFGFPWGDIAIKYGINDFIISDRDKKFGTSTKGYF